MSSRRLLRFCRITFLLQLGGRDIGDGSADESENAFRVGSQTGDLPLVTLQLHVDRILPLGKRLDRHVAEFGTFLSGTLFFFRQFAQVLTVFATLASFFQILKPRSEFCPYFDESSIIL